MYKTGSVVVISVAFVDFIAFVVFVGVFWKMKSVFYISI